MIVSTVIPKSSAKVRKYSFVVVNLRPCHNCSFADWINKITPSVNMGEKSYFRNNEGSYYYDMMSYWEYMTAIKRRKVMSVIDYFVADNPDSKSLWTKRFF